MKYNKIILFSSIALIFSLLLRFFQLNYIIEAATGFYKPEYSSVGNIMLIFIFVAIISASLFSYTSHRSPSNPPKKSIPVSICSFTLSIVTLLHLRLENYPQILTSWQISLLRLFGIATVVFFLLFGISLITTYKLHSFLTIIPILYLVARVICDFISISSLALISDNLLLMTAYCSSLLFMLNLARLYIVPDDDRNFKKLLFSGTMSASFCLVQSLPHIVTNLTNGYSYLHSSMIENLFILILGIFVLIFTLTHFSYKKLHNA